MTPIVRLAGITFNDGPDGDGDEYVVSDIDGWDGIPGDVAIVEKPVSDGGIVAYARRLSRPLVVSGWVIAGPNRMGPARRKLAIALNNIVTVNGTLEVDEEDATYRLTVRLTGALRTKQAAPLAVTFEAALLAATPAKTLVP